MHAYMYVICTIITYTAIFCSQSASRRSGCAFSPFKPNGPVFLINSTSLFLNLGVLGGNFLFFSKFL